MAGFAAVPLVRSPIGFRVQGARGHSIPFRTGGRRFQRTLMMASNKDSSGGKRRWWQRIFSPRRQKKASTAPPKIETPQPPTPPPPVTQQPPPTPVAETEKEPVAAEVQKTPPAPEKKEISQPVAQKQGGSIKDGVSGIQKLLTNNRYWAEKINAEQPDYFKELAKGQAPEFFWVGCADARVLTNFFTGTGPGDVFCHRNVGNIVMHTDMNCMSALEYSVTALGVKHVVVCGHYGCGAVNAALTLPQKSPGIVNSWIYQIRSVRNSYAKELQQLDEKDRWPKLCEANAVEQAFNACTAPIVQAAWAKGQELHVHAMIYDIATGRLKRLAGPISTIEQAVLMEDDYHENGGGEDLAKGPPGGGVKKDLHKKIVRALSEASSFEDQK
ncbi:hypothetical protein BSKO_02458 [Bryopsis sp. KO-2023]|nr:hypothetical protein BSKO_02458 [Bryopsis sp. KO-2023]